MYNDIQIIIMARGVGSRFWPMSSPDYPKQFIDVMGVGRSLIQLTVDRLKLICPVENMWVVTNGEMPESSYGTLIPSARQSAPSSQTLPASRTNGTFFDTEQEKEVVGKLFPTCEKISIDYAVMEKSKEIYTLPAEFGWSDLGSWGSLRTDFRQDEAGNAKVGKDIRLYECKNCVVHAADESKVVVQGSDGYIVAEKKGQLLVCSLKEEQRIKEFGK